MVGSFFIFVSSICYFKLTPHLNYSLKLYCFLTNWKYLTFQMINHVLRSFRCMTILHLNKASILYVFFISFSNTIEYTSNVFFQIFFVWESMISSHIKCLHQLQLFHLTRLNTWFFS